MRMARVDREVSAEDVGSAETPNFDQWYSDAYPRVARTLAVLFGDVETGRDLAAEAFSRAFERWEREDPPRSPDAWVMAVGINAGRRRWHRRRLEAEHLARLGTEASATTGDVTADPELWVAVAALAPREREAVVLRYVADLKERDIAEVMGIEVGTVSATLHRARARLRAALEGAQHDG